MAFASLPSASERLCRRRETMKPSPGKTAVATAHVSTTVTFAAMVVLEFSFLSHATVDSGHLQPEPGRTPPVIRVETNATVRILPDTSLIRFGGLPSSEEILLSFGLPEQPPARQWYEETQAPICHTEFVRDGIRYIQTVLATRLGDGPLPHRKDWSPKPVLLVHLAGENTAAEYTEANAAFAARIGKAVLALELKQGLVLAASGPKSPLGAVEVPSSGIATTHGTRLVFRGSMPPGTSGSMTIKIPLFHCEGDKDWEDLRDLDFAAELRRVKRFWLNRSVSDPAQDFPVAFASPQGH